MAVRLVTGGLQSYSPEAAARTTITKGTQVEGQTITTKKRKSSGGSSVGSSSSSSSQQSKLEPQKVFKEPSGSITITLPVKPQPNVLALAEQQRQRNYEATQQSSIQSYNQQREERNRVYGRGQPRPFEPLKKKTIGMMAKEKYAETYPRTTKAVSSIAARINIADEKASKTIKKGTSFIETRYLRGETIGQFLGEEADRQEAIVNQRFTDPVPRTLFKIPAFTLGAGEGLYNKVTEKPVSTATNLGVTYAGGFVVGGAFQTFALAGKITRYIATVASLGLVGYGSYETYKDFKGISSARVLGSKTSDTALEVAVFGLGARAGARTANYYLQELKVTYQTRKLNKDAIVIEQQVRINNKVITKQTISGEYRPPTKTIITTRFRQALGIKPIRVVKVTPAKYYTITPAGKYIVDNKPYNAVIQREGYKSISLKEISGTEFKEFNPKTTKLGKVDQYILNKLGTENNNFKYYRGTIKTYSITRGQNTKIVSFNRAIVKEKLVFESPEAYYLRGRVAYKPINTLRPSPRGNINYQNTIRTVYKEPVYFDTGSTSNIVTLATITKTPWSKTFAVQQQLTKTVINPPKSITTIQPVTVRTTITPINKIETQSVFYGRGTYEQTTGTGILSIQNTQQSSRQSLIQTPSVSAIQLESLSTKQLSSSTTKTISRQISRSNQVIVTKPIVVEVPKLDERIDQRVDQRVDQRQQQKLIQRQVSRSGFYTPSPRPPRRPPEETITPLGFKLPKIKSSSSSNKSYSVFGRRFGQFKFVGKSRTPKGAIKIGREYTGRTLAATFKIKGLPKQKISGFRTKEENGERLYIEPRGRRLKRGSGEVPEISFYRGLNLNFKR